MKKFRCMMDMLLAACLLFSFHASTRGEEPATAFTYQGRLNDGDGPANGSYDLTFALFSVGSGAGQVGSTLTNAATLVSNGLFAVTLDFGDQFPGANRWLEIGVRPNGGDAFATLAPRQALTASPYALYAPNAGTAATASSVPTANLTGTVPLVQLPGEVVINNETGVTLSGTFTGNGAGLTTLNASNLGSGTVPDARISGNVALLNRPNQAFTGGINSFSGSVGISIATPQTKLQVNGGDLTVSAGGNTSGAGGGIHFGIAFLPASSPMAKVQGLLVNASGAELQGSLGFFTRPFGSAGQSLTERVRITHDGNVGIGTTTPAGQLEVVDTVFTGAEAVDQQQTNGATSGGSAEYWQSFTAGMPGALTKIALLVSSPLSGTNSPGTIRIYAGEGVGGTLLATESVTILDLFQHPSYTNYQAFSLAIPPRVQAGSKYTIRMTVPAQDKGWVYYNTSNPYAGGIAAFNGIVYSSWDLRFKTYVTPAATDAILSVSPGNSGKVGIGTTTPGFPLTFPNTLGDKISLWGQSGTHYGFGIQAGLLQIHANSSSDAIVFGYGSSANFTETMRIDGAGILSPKQGFRCRAGRDGASTTHQFNFNWTGPGLQLWVDDAYLGLVSYVSDRRLKEDIQPMAVQAVARVMALQPATFKYKNIAGTIFTGDGQITEGFIADELQQVIPSAVTGEPDGLTSDGRIQPQTLNLIPVVSVLTKAVQEQQQTIQNLQQQIDELKAALSSLAETK